MCKTLFWTTLLAEKEEALREEKNASPGFLSRAHPTTFGGTPMHECARGKKGGLFHGKAEEPFVRIYMLVVYTSPAGKQATEKNV